MNSRKMTFVLFGTYLLFLTWIILFKLDISSTLSDLQYNRINNMGRSINLIPFAGTAIYNGVLDYREIGLNILCFIPFGIYMELLNRQASWLRNVSLILLTSLFYEVLQYMWNIGVADITDILANGLGGAIGIIIMYLLTSIWREKSYTYTNQIALLFTIVVAFVLFSI